MGNLFQTEIIEIIRGFFQSTLSQTSPGFYMSVVGVLKTLWEKEKLLIGSNFSFSHSVFYLFGELCHFQHVQNCHLQTLSVWNSLKFGVWKRINPLCFLSLCTSVSTSQKLHQLTWLNLFSHNPEMEGCSKHCWKRRKCWFPSFSPFLTMISILSKTETIN